MGAIQAIFRRHAAAYREQWDDAIPAGHQRVMDAIIDCRSPASGTVLYQCEDCDEPQIAARCCGKVGIAEQRIVRADDTEVVFRYRKVGSNRERTMSLAPAEFIRRFLQHVLPSGFMKVRHYGFLSPSCSMDIEQVKARIELAHGFMASSEKPSDAEPAPANTAPVCTHCGGRLRFCSVALPRPSSLSDLN